MTYPIHDPSCLSLQSGTDPRGFDYDAGDLDCDCGASCDNCSDPTEYGSKETACGRNHCPEHFAFCAACQKDLDEEWERLA